MELDIKLSGAARTMVISAEHIERLRKWRDSMYQDRRLEQNYIMSDSLEAAPDLKPSDDSEWIEELRSGNSSEYTDEDLSNLSSDIDNLNGNSFDKVNTAHRHR